jgi:hypothetical protein
MRATSLAIIPILALAAQLGACGDDLPTGNTPEPALIRVVSGDGQAGTAGHTLSEPLVVRVMDRHGRPAANGEVTFSASAGGSVNPATALTDAAGEARTTWTLGTSTADSQRVLASVMNPRTSQPLSVPLGARVAADVPAAADAASDSLRLGAPGTPLDDSLAIRVVDRYGNPVAGARVAWSVILGGGAVWPDTASTAADGVARAAWTLGGEGEQRATAAVAGTSVRVEFAARTPFDRTLTQVAAGESHACALDRDGGAWCWGRNDAGQLGTADTVGRRWPSRVKGGVRFIELTAGDGHTCGRDVDSLAYCWGSNAEGQLGTGSLGGAASTPARVGVEYKFYTISAGGAHTCGVPKGAPAYGLHCWGRNAEGQLGDGTTVNRGLPTRVLNYPEWEFSVGWRHTCTAYGSVRSSSVGWEERVVCWGSNDAGQLGSFAGTFSPFPVQAYPVRKRGLRVASITSGGRHSCVAWFYPYTPALPGLLECWGSNSAGQLGAGDFRQVSAGAEHTCGLRGNQLYCWGSNASGQLGNPAGGGATQVQVWPDGPGFSDVDAGGAFTCALAATGHAYCWGSNQFGQLGNGPATGGATPVRVG